MKIREDGFLRQVVEVATLLGWESVHFRPARTAHGWRTPVQGSMGEGWPDLTLVRGARLLFVELKADGGKVSPEQERVLAILRVVAEVHVWRPTDWERMAEVLG